MYSLYDFVVFTLLGLSYGRKIEYICVLAIIIVLKILKVMYLHKHLSANNFLTEKFPFTRELAMESYLIENESILNLESDGFNEVSIIESEVKLINGRKNNDGRVDILAKYGEEYLAIVELKKGMLTEDHLTQLQEYLNEKEQILKKFPNAWDKSVGDMPKWIGVMVGETIDPYLMLKIRKGYYYQEIPIAALTINRYKGEDGNIYVITDTYFTQKVSGRDYTKYEFNNVSYPKNRLVLAIIKYYVSVNPNVTYSDLERIFPQSLQGRETFTTKEKALSKYDRRNFIKVDEFITLKDSVISVSTQWGKGNIDNFIKHVEKELGYKIIAKK